MLILYVYMLIQKSLPPPLCFRKFFVSGQGYFIGLTRREQKDPEGGKKGDLQVPPKTRQDKSISKFVDLDSGLGN